MRALTVNNIIFPQYSPIFIKNNIDDIEFNESLKKQIIT